MKPLGCSSAAGDELGDELLRRQGTRLVTRFRQRREMGIFREQAVGVRRDGAPCWYQGRQSSLAQFGARLADDFGQALELSRAAVLLGFGCKLTPESLLLHDQQNPMEYQQARIVHGLNALDDFRT